MKAEAETASKQLDRVLSFFARVESKISALFAVNTALLAVLAVNAKEDDLLTWYLPLLGAVSITAITASLYFLYRSSYPNLKGGEDSLIYFRSIASRTEQKYIDAALACDEDGLARELLAQVWRNSVILKDKFESLRLAFCLTAGALPFWFLTLLLASMKHSTLLIR